MSKQFRFYLTPVDIELLCAQLRKHAGLRILQETSSTDAPVQIESAISRRSIWFPKQEATSVRCFLAPMEGADVRLDYYPTLSHWKVQHTSEVIEFSGADFNGKVLLIGRFYFQNDLVIDDVIVPKRKEFLDWADRVFRISKRFLYRSNVLQAYLGDDVERFRKDGGRLASSFRPDRTPVFDE